MLRDCRTIACGQIGRRRHACSCRRRRRLTSGGRWSARPTETPTVFTRAGYDSPDSIQATSKYSGRGVSRCTPMREGLQDSPARPDVVLPAPTRRRVGTSRRIARSIPGSSRLRRHLRPARRPPAYGCNASGCRPVGPDLHRLPHRPGANMSATSWNILWDEIQRPRRHVRQPETASVASIARP
jgi:hypothetical protein